MSGFVTSSFGTGLVSVSLGISVPQMFTCPEKQILPIIPHTWTLTHSCCPYCHPGQNYKKLKCTLLIAYFQAPPLARFSGFLFDLQHNSHVYSPEWHSTCWTLSQYKISQSFTFRLGAYPYHFVRKYFHVISFSLVLFQLSFAVLQVETVHWSGTEKVLVSFFLSPYLSVQTCLLAVPFLPTFICLLYTGLFLILFCFLWISCLK